MRVGEDVDDDDDDVDDELEDEMGDDDELDNGGMFVNEGDEKKKKQAPGQKKMKSMYASGLKGFTTLSAWLVVFPSERLTLKI